MSHNFDIVIKLNNFTLFQANIRLHLDNGHYFPESAPKNAAKRRASIRSFSLKLY